MVGELLDPDEALACVLENASAREDALMPLEKALGATLAQEVIADRDAPPFDRASMDGFAIRCSDAGRRALVSGEVAAGGQARRPVERGGCVRIMTGAPCPEGADAVVPVEDAREDGDEVLLPSGIKPGQHIVRRGSECRAGEVLFMPGQPITELATAVLASVGCARVRVRERPRLSIITTGAEIVGANGLVDGSQIRDANGPMLRALALGLGLDEPRVLHAEDTAQALDAALSCASADRLIVLSGGVSAGRFDLVPAALRRAGAEVLFHGVAQKPGKPLLFARNQTSLFFGLPGNPLSSLICFLLYVAPAARQLMGRLPHALSSRGRLTSPLLSHGERTQLVLACAQGKERAWTLTPLTAGSSADIFATRLANCFIRLAPGETALERGSEVDFQWVSDRTVRP